MKMTRLFRFCVLAACLAIPSAGCGDSSKPAEPKVNGGNPPDPNIKRVGVGNAAGGGAPAKAPAPGGQTTSSPN